MSALEIGSRHQRWRILLALLPFWFLLPTIAQVKAAERVSPCKASQLSAANDLNESDWLDGGTGHHALTIVVQNRASSPCLLQGIPTVAFLDKSKHRLVVPVCSGCLDYLFPVLPAREIILQPKGSAYVVLGYDINNGEHGEIPCRNAVTLSLHLPGQSAPLRGSVEGPGYCTKLWPGRYHTVSWEPCDRVMARMDTRSRESAELIRMHSGHYCASCLGTTYSFRAIIRASGYVVCAIGLKLYVHTLVERHDRGAVTFAEFRHSHFRCDFELAKFRKAKKCRAAFLPGSSNESASGAGCLSR